jgi:hypothetical protein
MKYLSEKVVPDQHYNITLPKYELDGLSLIQLKTVNVDFTPAYNVTNQ